MFKRLFAKKAIKVEAYRVYSELVGQARNAVFYERYGVEDTIDGRFDMILLHLFLVDHRLEQEGEGYIEFRRFIQEAMVSDLDRSFRELGVGDMSVGKEMKKVGAAWLGRSAAYKAALENEDEERQLDQVVMANIYRDNQDKDVRLMVSYIQRSVETLKNTVVESFETCSFNFPDPTV
ncbi:ubiquinol-cytochrome C chaperone family protein [Kordiimonas laminariae]|uniref:ubiquinol-cytochrome C chaperone family protein n=1 Tax=Kordiimonas laminariae TaxID=2917717 RepID=UPI001FF2998B|nr:ubiquinol-cytochrome C chaperone family protein [Kordiimonas laminariae]MCK0070400.1 hypothetical protein [Kordiimonas laminariae]